MDRYNPVFFIILSFTIEICVLTYADESKINFSSQFIRKKGRLYVAYIVTHNRYVYFFLFSNQTILVYNLINYKTFFL